MVEKTFILNFPVNFWGKFNFSRREVTFLYENGVEY